MKKTVRERIHQSGLLFLLAYLFYCSPISGQEAAPSIFDFDLSGSVNSSSLQINLDFNEDGWLDPFLVQEDALKVWYSNPTSKAVYPLFSTEIKLPPQTLYILPRSQKRDILFFSSDGLYSIQELELSDNDAGNITGEEKGSFVHVISWEPILPHRFIKTKPSVLEEDTLADIDGDGRKDFLFWSTSGRLNILWSAINPEDAKLQTLYTNKADNKNRPQFTLSKNEKYNEFRPSFRRRRFLNRAIIQPANQAVDRTQLRFTERENTNLTFQIHGQHRVQGSQQTGTENGLTISRQEGRRLWDLNLNKLGMKLHQHAAREFTLLEADKSEDSAAESFNDTFEELPDPNPATNYLLLKKLRQQDTEDDWEHQFTDINNNSQPDIIVSRGRQGGIPPLHTTYYVYMDLDPNLPSVEVNRLRPDHTLRTGSLYTYPLLKDYNNDTFLDLVTIEPAFRAASVNDHVKAFMKQGLEVRLVIYLCDSAGRYTSDRVLIKPLSLHLDAYGFSGEDPYDLINYDFDFNGDGLVDIIWQGRSGFLGIEYQDAKRGFSESYSWSITITGSDINITNDDLNQNGKSDIILYYSTKGRKQARAIVF
jgi:hypothetical protein